MFRDPDGKFSFARIACTVLLSFALAWGSYIVFYSKAMPDLLGITALIGSIYGANKVAGVIADKQSQ